MNRIRFAAMVGFAGVVSGLLSFGALAASEEEWLETVREGTDPIRVSEACRMLRVRGSARSVPALATLLGKDRVGEAARFALEGMPFPEATLALREAFDRLAGEARLGVIDSLGWRRDLGSVPKLVPLLLDPDATVAGFVASALGRIGGDEAVRALERVRDRVALSVRRTVAESLLAEAERRQASGGGAEADRIRRTLTGADEEESVRLAAWIGWVRGGGGDRMSRLSAALRDADPSAHTAAVTVAFERRSPEVTKWIVAELPGATPGLQVAMLRVLQHHADPESAGSVRALLKASETEVRLAAMSALGEVGGPESVMELLGGAACDNPIEQDSARLALVLLRPGGVDGALFSAILDGTAATRLEAFRALGARGDPAVVPRLLDWARSSDDEVRAGAVQAAGRLARPEHLAALVRWLDESNDPAVHDDARGVVESMVERAGPDAVFDSEPIVRGLSEGSAERRTRMAPLASMLVDERVRSALTEATKHVDAGVRAAALRAMSASRDPGCVDALIDAIGRTSEPGLRRIALEGLVRLAGEGVEKGSEAERSKRSATIRGLARSPEELQIVSKAIRGEGAP